MKGPDWIKSLGLGGQMPNHNIRLFSRASKGVLWTPSAVHHSADIPTILVTN